MGWLSRPDEGSLRLLTPPGATLRIIVLGRTTLATSVTALSEYVLEALREGAEFTLYRGRKQGDLRPVLGVALVAEQPSPQSLQRLEHEYSLASELHPAWSA